MRDRQEDVAADSPRGTGIPSDEGRRRHVGGRMGLTQVARTVGRLGHPHCPTHVVRPLDRQDSGDQERQHGGARHGKETRRRITDFELDGGRASNSAGAHAHGQLDHPTHPGQMECGSRLAFKTPSKRGQAKTIRADRHPQNHGQAEAEDLFAATRHSA